MWAKQDRVLLARFSALIKTWPLLLLYFYGYCCCSCSGACFSHSSSSAGVWIHSNGSTVTPLGAKGLCYMNSCRSTTDLDHQARRTWPLPWQFFFGGGGGRGAMFVCFRCDCRNGQSKCGLSNAEKVPELWRKWMNHCFPVIRKGVQVLDGGRFVSVLSAKQSGH